MACAGRGVCPGGRVGTSAAQARRWAAQAIRPWSVRRLRVTIVMGLDQHRAQITAEWLDTATRRDRRARGSRRPTARGVRRVRWPLPWPGARGRVGGDDRAGGSSSRSSHAVGARVHLAEPAETAARRGTKKRAKSDRADARHLRELLMVGPAAGVMDPARASARAARPRPAAAHARRRTPRVAATDAGGLYHHGVPPRSWLLGAASRAWLAELSCAVNGARADHHRARRSIDALRDQLVPLDQQLRDYANASPAAAR